MINPGTCGEECLTRRYCCTDITCTIIIMCTMVDISNSSPREKMPSYTSTRTWDSKEYYDLDSSRYLNRWGGHSSVCSNTVVNSMIAGV